MEEESQAVTKFVTARELGRRTAQLLDAVGGGVRLVVTRHGVPVATMVATENVALVQRARAVAPEEPFQEEDDVALDRLSLADEAYTVLESYGRLRSVDRVSRETGMTVGDVSIALVRLELAKLIKRGPGGYNPTRLGLRVLDARQKGLGAGLGSPNLRL